jgi:hypothetical protein
MTSDDERWERDLRAGLGVLLDDDVRPGQPPVAAVLRKGRAMRVSQRLTVVAGVVVATAAAVAVPALGGGGQPSAAGVGQAEVIAAGRIQGHPWRIVVDQKTGRLCAGEAGLRQSCVGLRSLEHLSGLASLSGASVPVQLRRPVASAGPPAWNALFGIVRPDVTRVVLSLTTSQTVKSTRTETGDGSWLYQFRGRTRTSAISLRPIAAAGYRWIGFIWVPYQDTVGKATVYSGDTELGYSQLDYGGGLRPGTYYVSWYYPGETWPTSHGTYIAGGGSGGDRWDAYVDAGPWGYCVSFDAPVPDGLQQNCWQPAWLRARPGVIIMRGGSPPTVPRWIMGTAGPSVAYLRMTLASGRSVTVPVAVVSGQGFYAMQIGPGPVIVRWGAYDAAGHRLYGGVGPPDSGS